MGLRRKRKAMQISLLFLLYEILSSTLWWNCRFRMTIIFEISFLLAIWKCFHMWEVGLTILLREINKTEFCGQLEYKHQVSNIRFRSSTGDLLELSVLSSPTSYCSVSVKTGLCPGEGNGILLQGSCLGNPMDRGAWWVTVHGVTHSQTRFGEIACMYAGMNFPYTTRLLGIPLGFICNLQKHLLLNLIPKLWVYSQTLYLFVLQPMRSQSVGHDLETEQTQIQISTMILIFRWFFIPVTLKLRVITKFSQCTFFFSFWN